MYCVQCGAKIEDGFKFCPGCGCPVGGLTKEEPEDTRSEFEKMVDEIFWEKPSDSWKNAKILSKRANIPFGEACKIMNAR